MARVRVLLVDTETTGLGVEDEPVALALLQCDVDDSTGRAIGEVQAYHGLRQPGVAIQPAAQRIHGLSLEALRGLDFDHARVNEWVASADVLVAHNAAFDVRMLQRLYPNIGLAAWRCTYRQWPWSSAVKGRKLTDAATFCSVDASGAHNALGDVRMLWAALQASTGKTDRAKAYLHRLLAKPPFALEVYLRQEQQRFAKGRRVTTALSSGGLGGVAWRQAATLGLAFVLCVAWLASCIYGGAP